MNLKRKIYLLHLLCFFTFFGSTFSQNILLLDLTHTSFDGSTQTLPLEISFWQDEGWCEEGGSEFCSAFIVNDLSNEGTLGADDDSDGVSNFCEQFPGDCPSFVGATIREVQSVDFTSGFGFDFLVNDFIAPAGVGFEDLLTQYEIFPTTNNGIDNCAYTPVPGANAFTPSFICEDDVENLTNNIGQFIVEIQYSFPTECDDAPADGVTDDILSWFIQFNLYFPEELMLDTTVLEYECGYNTSCDGANDGVATVSVSGGVPPYIYSWTDSSGTEVSNTATASGLSPGTYTITVTDDASDFVYDSNGNGLGVICSETIIITEAEPIDIILSTDDSKLEIDCFEDCDGNIEIDIIGGCGPYTYSWVGPEGFTSDTKDISGLCVGDYSLTITDSNDCLQSFAQTITGPSDIIITKNEATSEDSDGCDNLGSIDIEVTGGTPFSPSPEYLYDWSIDTDLDGVGDVVISNDQDISNLAAGTYYITVTDANGCNKEDSFIITWPGPFTVVIEATSKTELDCFGDCDGNIDISPGGGSGDYTYSWIGPDGFTSTDQNIAGLCAGEYLVTLTDVNFPECIWSELVDITEPDAPLALSGVPTNNLCFGDCLGEIDITVTGGTVAVDYTYSWTGPGGFTSTDEDISNLCAGTYSVSIIDDNGCPISDTFEITEPDAPLALSGVPTNNSCFGDCLGEIDITVTGGTLDYTYSWTGPDGFTSTDQNIASLCAGTYSVSIIDENGCETSDTFEIIEPEALNISFASISGEALNCNTGQLSVLIEGGTAPYTYEWDNGSIDSNLFNLCAGDYTVIVTDYNGCSISQTGTVELLIPEGWEVDETTCSHEIFISSDATLLLDGVDLNIGDYVGVFFVNNEGGISCGGYTIWEGDSTSILAYGNDGENNGFEEGEQFQWKVYNGETNSGFAIYDDSYEFERYFSGTCDAQSGIHGAILVSIQTIPLNENPFSDWDMISTYIDSDEDVVTIMSPIINNFIIIKDASGLAYWPAIPVTTLDFMNTREAYAIKTWAPSEINVLGDFTQPEFTSNSWQSGWNYISYSRYWSNSVEIALSSVVSNIKLLKDDSGNIVWPELGISTIENMEAGEGYLLKLYNAQEFSYDSNSDFYPEDWASGNNNSDFAQRFGIDLEYYQSISKTSSNMTIGFPKYALSAQESDELAVFDELGNVVGVSKLTVDNNYVVVWGDDEDLVEKSGLLVGEKMSFQLWKKSSNELFDIIPTWKEGDDLFSLNGINIAESIIIEPAMNSSLTITCYPNPASDYINVELNVSDDTNSNIYLVDNLGKVIYFSNYLLNSGVNRIVIPLDNVSKGIYYLEVSGNNFVERMKIDILY